MVAYQIFRFDKAQNQHLIGILPERRKHPERITEKSVMERIRELFPGNEDFHNIFFAELSLDE